MKLMYGEILTEILNVFYLCCTKTYKFSKSVSVSVFRGKEEKRKHNLMAVQTSDFGQGPKFQSRIYLLTYFLHGAESFLRS
jgi:hypothetical protein